MFTITNVNIHMSGRERERGREKYAVCSSLKSSGDSDMSLKAKLTKVDSKYVVREFTLYICIVECVWRDSVSIF